MERLSFLVVGDPVQQGSKTIGYAKGGRAFIRDDNPAPLRVWRKLVVAAAREAAMSQGVPLLRGAVELQASFRITQPPSVKREYPSVRPDLDKLLRALMDGISDAQCVWEDDARVVRIVTEEAYAPRPGVLVTVTALERRAE
jgi:Holliday junction resolvase RusA-like endonuclease